MNRSCLIPSTQGVFCAALAVLLVACGSGGGSSSPPPAPPPATVGPAGGTVSGPSGAQVVIPAGALASATAIAVDQSSTGAPALPAGMNTFGAMFAFTPHGTAFAVPVTVTVPFNAAAVPAGATPVLYKTTGTGTWERVASAAVSASTVTAQVSAFSWIIVGNVAPIITTPPASVSVVEPATARFSVVAIGTPPFSYQWQRSDDGGFNFTDIAAATAASYTTPATTVANDNGDRFRVRVSNLEGASTSQAATLTVSANIVAPAITTQPQNQSVAVGASATFTAAASGTAPGYQWQRSGDGINWTNIAGATNASYTLANAQAADNGAQFRVLASNSAGTATSNAATLTVTSAPPPAGAGRIAAGNGFSLAVNAAGVPYSWGADGVGQLGNGTPNADRNTAAPLGTLNAVRSVHAGAGSQAIAVRTDGTVWAWGYGGSVTCDFGATFNTPAQIGGAANIVAASTGADHTLLLRNDGVVLAFGCNDSGQLGRAGIAPAASAVVVAGLPPITAIAAGGALSLAVDNNGNVWAWGRGALGVVAGGLVTPRATPQQIAGLTNVTAVAAAGDHALALRSDGSVWTWGSNGNGKLGIGSGVASQLTPVASGLGAGITAIAAGGDNSMALRNDGVVLVVGINEVGQLGAPTPGFSNTWVAVPGVSSAVAIAAGPQSATSHLFAVRADGSVLGWGWNNFGQVGIGVTGTNVLPAPVTGLNLN